MSAVDLPRGRATPSASLQASGTPIAPKALALTLFARMFVCDLFIHGVGGGRYDRVTDGDRVAATTASSRRGSSSRRSRCTCRLARTSSPTTRSQAAKRAAQPPRAQPRRACSARSSSTRRDERDACTFAGRREDGARRGDRGAGCGQEGARPAHPRGERRARAICSRRCGESLAAQKRRRSRPSAPPPRSSPTAPTRSASGLPRRSPTRSGERSSKDSARRSRTMRSIGDAAAAMIARHKAHADRVERIQAMSVPVVDPNLCTACGICVDECPQSCYDLEDIAVLSSSRRLHRVRHLRRRVPERRHLDVRPRVPRL